MSSVAETSEVARTYGRLREGGIVKTGIIFRGVAIDGEQQH